MNDILKFVIVVPLLMSTFHQHSTVCSVAKAASLMLSDFYLSCENPLRNETKGEEQMEAEVSA